VGTVQAGTCRHGRLICVTPAFRDRRPRSYFGGALGDQSRELAVPGLLGPPPDSPKRSAAARWARSCSSERVEPVAGCDFHEDPAPVGLPNPSWFFRIPASITGVPQVPCRRPGCLAPAIFCPRLHPAARLVHWLEGADPPLAARELRWARCFRPFVAFGGGDPREEGLVHRGVGSWPRAARPC